MGEQVGGAAKSAIGGASGIDDPVGGKEQQDKKAVKGGGKGESEA